MTPSSCNSALANGDRRKSSFSENVAVPDSNTVVPVEIGRKKNKKRASTSRGQICMPHQPLWLAAERQVGTKRTGKVDGREGVRIGNEQVKYSKDTGRRTDVDEGRNGKVFVPQNRANVVVLPKCPKSNVKPSVRQSRGASTSTPTLPTATQAHRTVRD